MLVSEPKHDVHADFELSLVRHGSKLQVEVLRHGGPSTFNGDTNAWGYEDIGARGELEDPEYLKDDTVLIPSSGVTSLC